MRTAYEDSPFVDLKSLQVGIAVDMGSCGGAKGHLALRKKSFQMLPRTNSGALRNVGSYTFTRFAAPNALPALN